VRFGPVRWLATGVVATLYLVACSNDTPSTPAAAGSTVAPTSSTSATATLVVSDSSLGRILTDARGNTLYLFETDRNRQSTCYEGCDTTWPPLEATGAPTVGDGLDDSSVGTTKRTDGITQVTYAGHPLYFYSGDSAPGDTNGQGIGDVWYAVTPAGDPVGGQIASSSASEGSDDKGGMYG